MIWLVFPLGASLCKKRRKDLDNCQARKESRHGGILFLSVSIYNQFMGDILKFPNRGEIPQNKTDRSEERSAEEKLANFKRFSGIKSKAILIETNTKDWFEHSPKRTRQVVELRRKEFSDLETAHLENRILSSAPAEWRERPAYWRAVVEELRSRS